MQRDGSIFNPEDFGRFFSENNARFVDIAFSYVRDMDAAQDIVMDSFVRIWQRREELADETNMRGYAYMCVRNRCCSYLRQVSMRRQLSPTDMRLAQSSIESLPQDYAEIAERFGISVRRVTSEIQSALQILRRALKDYLPLCLLFLFGK